MARCSDCNKFVALTGGDADCAAWADDETVSLEVTVTAACEECGSEIKTATLEASWDEESFGAMRETHLAYRAKRLAEQQAQEAAREAAEAADPSFEDASEDVEVPDEIMALDADANADLEVEDCDENEGKTGRGGKSLKPKWVKYLLARGSVDVRCECGCGASRSLDFELDTPISDMEDA